MNDKYINIYTDGACINNGKPGAVASIGIHFANKKYDDISEKVDSTLKQTNNVAELMAIIKAYTTIKNEKYDKINIYSDSTYAISCCTDYGKKVIKENKTKAPNYNLIVIVQKMFDNNTKVNFSHIKAHTDNKDEHSIGNDKADKLANEALGLRECPYQKIYLKIPFSEKDYVKKNGGKWDGDKKMWYIWDSNINKDILLKKYNGVSNNKKIENDFESCSDDEFEWTPKILKKIKKYIDDKEKLREIRKKHDIEKSIFKIKIKEIKSEIQLDTD